MHALTWIRTRGRFLRSITARQLRQTLGRTGCECTWCGCVCRKPRRRWCSDSCVRAFEERCSRRGVRAALRRDKYRCRICGLDAPKLARLDKHLKTEPAARAAFHAHLRTCGLTVRQGIHLGLLEVDHIIPVCEGGGLAGLPNYRTLCQACHTQVSRELQLRRRGQDEARVASKKSRRAPRRERPAVKRSRRRKPR